MAMLVIGIIPKPEHEKTALNIQVHGCFARRAGEDRRETAPIKEKPLCL